MIFEKTKDLIDLQITSCIRKQDGGQLIGLTLFSIVDWSDLPSLASSWSVQSYLHAKRPYPSGKCTICWAQTTSGTKTIYFCTYFYTYIQLKLKHACLSNHLSWLYGVDNLKTNCCLYLFLWFNPLKVQTCCPGHTLQLMGCLSRTVS